MTKTIDPGENLIGAISQLLERQRIQTESLARIEKMLGEKVLTRPQIARHWHMSAKTLSAKSWLLGPPDAGNGWYQSTVLEREEMRKLHGDDWLRTQEEEAIRRAS